jgi:hypothetical protein
MLPSVAGSPAWAAVCITAFGLGFGVAAIARPAILHVLGAVSVETASRKRICYRDRKKHAVAKGEVCLVIQDGASGGSKNYCVSCALAILDQAADDLQRLRDQFA